MDVRTAIPTNCGYWVTKFGEAWRNQVNLLQQKFGDSIEQVLMPPNDAVDMPTVFVKRSAIIEVLSYVKSEPGFEYGFFSDLTATDEMEDPRFIVVYHLFSLTRHWRIRFKVRVKEDESVPTATHVWPAANWAEREVWDMFGIKFEGHPDLRRILMDERWVGHPLRKDYPIRGYQLFPTPMDARPELLED